MAAGTFTEIWLLLLLLWWATTGISRAEAETKIISRIPAENPYPVMRLSSAGEIIYGNDASEIFRGEIERDENLITDRLREWAIEAFKSGERTFHEIEVGDRIFNCTFAPILESESVNLYASDITTTRRSEQLLERRVRELGALFGLTDRLNRSRDLDQIFDGAIDSIIDALRCDRASILLFNKDGRMDFVAWRGLSAEYRLAVSGHSPWTADDVDATPIAIEDIATSDQPVELKNTISLEGIKSLAFVPLISNDELIGKFMVYFNDRHRFTESEFEIATTIGHQIAFGVNRARVEAERLASEVALKENLERLKITTQAGKVGVWDWDVRTNRITWSESVYHMHGVTDSEFDGTVEFFTQLVHSEDRESVSEAIQRSVEHLSPYEAEFRVVRRSDGGISWLFTNGVVLADEQGAYRMIGATVDITERKNAEVQASKLAAIVENSLDAIVSKDLSGYVTSWNRGAERLLGYSAGEMIGQNIAIIFPHDRLQEEKMILERIKNGDYVEPYETVRRRKDGTLLEISLSVSPIFDSSGNVVGASKIARDITERKRAEAALRESEIMHRLVDAQESERHRIARDLHDHLGQQLTGLRLKLESIRNQCDGRPELLKDVDDMREIASRIDLDINFLSWELRPTELDNLGLRDALSSFVREWSANYGINAQFHSAVIDERLHPEIETNLYRIVQEALHNILKHAEARNVDVLLEQRGDQAILIIEDDGVGFDLDKDPSERGTSLGIIGMYERAALLGGSLDIESRPGSGTSIFARVPIRSLSGNGHKDETSVIVL